MGPPSGASLETFGGEWSALRKRLGFLGKGWFRAVLTHIAVIGVFGVFLPWTKGTGFLDRVILGAYACLGVVFSAPAASVAFEGSLTVERALGRIVSSVFYGELMAAVISCAGVLTTYASHHWQLFVGPDLQSLAQCALLGVALSCAMSTIAVWAAIQLGPKFSRTLVRVVFLGLLIALYFRSGWLPDVALQAAGIAAAVAITAFLGLRRASA